MSDFRNRIKYLREKYCITQVEMAERIGVNVSSVSRYERGQIEPTLDVVCVISKCFNVTIDWLAGYEQLGDERVPEGYRLCARQLYEKKVPINNLIEYCKDFTEMNQK